MTLKEMYLAEKAKKSPIQSFLAEVANVTKRTEGAVRLWVYGVSEPDELAKTALAEHFKLSVDELFPPKKQTAV